MTPFYKIEIPKTTYEQILLPIADNAALKLSIQDDGDTIVVYIENDSVARFLKCTLIRKIDDYEVVQSAFSKMQTVPMV